MLETLLRRLLGLERRVERLETVEGSPVWTDWTPTVTQDVAVAATVTEAKYALVGKVAHIQAYLSITGAGTGANVIVIGGIPAAIAPVVTAGDPCVGIASIVNAGTAWYIGGLLVMSATQFRVAAHAAANYVGAEPNFALANGDKISFVATYRVA